MWHEDTYTPTCATQTAVTDALFLPTRKGGMVGGGKERREKGDMKCHFPSFLLTAAH